MMMMIVMMMTIMMMKIMMIMMMMIMKMMIMRYLILKGALPVAMRLPTNAPRSVRIIIWIKFGSIIT